MCLLIALFQVVEDAPLMIAANRDEQRARPAVTMTVLQDHDPRILGGRDELAGGTWLAVNEHGVVAGLTNQPVAGRPRRDPDKKSRGGLPLAFAACRSADEAVSAVVPDLDPADYNACWLLVADRESLFSVGLVDGLRPDVTALPPGRHVLENRPFGTPTVKTAHVAAMVAERVGVTGPDAAAAGLAEVLADHRPAAEDRRPAPPAGDPERSPALSAACVHTPSYGTRSGLIVTVPAAGAPRLRVADGPPCEVPFEDVTSLWSGAGLDCDPARR